MTSLPYLGYVRISQLGAREAGSNQSESEQRAVVERIARTHDLALGEFIADEDVSGMTFDRPGWNRAIELVESGAAAGIVAYDMERISRGRTADTLTAIADIESAGGRLYDQSGRLSVESIDDEVLTTVKAMIARQDVRRKKQYLDTSRRRAIERGVHLAVPYGYMRSDGPGTPLAKNELEAPTVRRCFELRADGHSWAAIASDLNESGVLPRPFVKDRIEQQGRWTTKSIVQLVRSRVYLGVAFSGEFEREDAHPAIVDRDLFERANRSTGKKWSNGRSRDGYLLSGLVRCSGCGYVMVRAGNYYRCRPDQHASGCELHTNVPAVALEDHVRAHFLGLFADEEFFAVEDTSDVDELRSRLEAAKIELGVAVRFAGSARSSGEPDVVLDVLEDEVRTKTSHVRTLDAELRHAELRVRGIDLPSEFVPDGFDSLTVPEQRHALSVVFGAVVVRPAAVWREDVAARASFITRSETPAESLRVIAQAAGR